MGDSTNLPWEGLLSLVDLTSDAACLVDADGSRILYANPELLRLIRSTGATVVGRSIYELVPDLDTPAVRGLVSELVNGKRREARIDFSSPAALANHLLAELRVRRVPTARGLMLAIVLKASNTTSALTANQRESLDPLTGLADRGFILKKLHEILQHDRQGPQQCVVLFVDVDGFKQVNDAYGHLVGDRVLCEVARRLTSCVRSRDHLARFGGDEFLVLLESGNAHGTIESVIGRIQAAFLPPISLPQVSVTLGVSVGAARAGADGNTPEALIDAADRAMYAAKRASA